MILTSYIFKQTFKNVLVSTLVFVSVIWLSQSFKTIKLIINKGAGLFDFFILSIYSFPNWLLIALPLGTFAGCMLSYFRLENDKEIIVMKAAGLSSIKIGRAAIIIAFLLSLFLLIVSHIILPITYKNFKVLQNKIRNNAQTMYIKDNIFIDVNENQTIFISELDDKNYFQQIFIQDRTNSSNTIEYYSKNGYLAIVDGKINLFMNEGSRVSTDNKKNSTILDFREYQIEIEENKKKSEARRIVEYNEYNFFDLIKKANKSKSKRGKLLAEAHSRNTVFFLPIIFVLIVMITVLNGNYSRTPSIYRKTFSIIILVILQSLMIIIKNLVHSNTALLPAMYLFPLFVTILGFFILHKNINLNKVLIKRSNVQLQQ